MRSLVDFLELIKSGNNEVPNAVIFLVPPFYDFSKEKVHIMDALNLSVSSPDLKIVEGKDFSIDEARLLASFFAYETVSGIKLTIIQNIEEAPHASLQAILKILEEPGQDSIVLMTSANLSKLPTTILSRSQLFSIDVVQNKDQSLSVDNLRKNYPLLLSSFEQDHLDFLDKTLSQIQVSSPEKIYYPIFDMLNKYKEDRNVYILSLLILVNIVSQKMLSVSVNNPHYKGLTKLVKMIDEIYSQRDILSHHHFEYPWFAFSLLKI